MSMKNDVRRATGGDRRGARRLRLSRRGTLRGPLPGAGTPRTVRGPRLRYASAPPDSPGTRRLFYALFAGILAALVGGMGWFVVRWDHPSSVALFAVLSVLFFGSAYGLARQVVALTTRRGGLPSLKSLERRPRVAILYTTMNDVVPECLQAIHQDYPVDVFVLDDSSRPEARETVDRISAARKFTVVRRTARRGFKAGAINDWFAVHGGKFDYFVLLDADSFLPSDWVGEALRFAEHPANARVAIFQGLINIWNFDTRFVQTLAPMSRVGQFEWEERLANSLDTVFCYGHNVLMRRSAVSEIGGFVEGYVSEDFATVVALADRDWHSRFVPLHTYEATPENVRGFIKRQNKWTRGAMEFLAFARRSDLPASRKFHLLQTPVSHFANLLLPVGMLLTVYGFTSSYSGAGQLLTALAVNPLGTFWSIPLFRYLSVI
ncbi:MAG: glycosyltransferase, partial [Thermoplasmata archaeon]|nr:glycosyltransferase [Thermoplasmata archaeon]